MTPLFLPTVCFIYQLSDLCAYRMEEEGDCKSSSVTSSDRLEKTTDGESKIKWTIEEVNIYICVYIYLFYLPLHIYMLFFWCKVQIYLLH